MKLQRLTYLVLFSSLLLTACLDDMDWQKEKTDPVTAVVFNTEIQTRASGTAWASGDNIGVYMVPANKTLTDSIIEGNKKYVTTSGDGKFVADGEENEIYFPEDSSLVDFIAYYPYRSDIPTSFGYTVNVGGDQAQTGKLEEIDLLYSNNLKGGKIGSNTNNKLVFSHKMAAINLTLQEKNGESLNNMTVTISGMNTTATFSLVNGAFTSLGTVTDIKALTKTTTSKATAEAIIIPAGQVTGGKIKIVIPSSDKTYVWDIPQQGFETGKKYTYDFEVGTELVLLNSEITDWDEEVYSDEPIVLEEEEDEEDDDNEDDEE